LPNSRKTLTHTPGVTPGQHIAWAHHTIQLTDTGYNHSRLAPLKFPFAVIPAGAIVAL